MRSTYNFFSLPRSSRPFCVNFVFALASCCMRGTACSFSPPPPHSSAAFLFVRSSAVAIRHETAANGMLIIWGFQLMSETRDSHAKFANHDYSAERGRCMSGFSSSFVHSNAKCADIVFLVCVNFDYSRDTRPMVCVNLAVRESKRECSCCANCRRRRHDSPPERHN